VKFVDLPETVTKSSVISGKFVSPTIFGRSLESSSTEMCRITSSFIGALEGFEGAGEDCDVAEFVLAELVGTALLFLLCSVVVHANETETRTARKQRMQLFFIGRVCLNVFVIVTRRRH
jgi:hypothetical protein